MKIAPSILKQTLLLVADFIWYSVLLFALSLLLLVLIGCTQKQTNLKSVTIPARTSVASGQSIAPFGIPVTLVWDTEGPIQCRLYASADKTNWSLIQTTETNRAVVNVVAPKYYKVVSVKDDLESLPSNTLGIMGRDEVVIVTGEYSGDTLTWTAYPQPVFIGTNVSGQQFFRTAIKRVNRWQTTSE